MVLNNKYKNELLFISSFAQTDSIYKISFKIAKYP